MYPYECMRLKNVFLYALIHVVHVGGEIVSTFGHPELVKLGECKVIEEVMIGEDKVCVTCCYLTWHLLLFELFFSYLLTKGFLQKTSVTFLGLLALADKLPCEIREKFDMTSEVTVHLFNSITVEPPLMATSLQWPFFFLADSPYTDWLLFQPLYNGHFLLSPRDSVKGQCKEVQLQSLFTVKGGVSWAAHAWEVNVNLAFPTLVWIVFSEKGLS